MGLMFKKNLYRAGSGKRLTGMARYTEVLERDFKKLFPANLATLICFLPFAAGVVFSILTRGSKTGSKRSSRASSSA